MGVKSCIIGVVAMILGAIIGLNPLSGGAVVFAVVWFVSYVCMVLHANHKELTALRAEMKALQDELENIRRTEKAEN